MVGKVVVLCVEGKPAVHSNGLDVGCERKGEVPIRTLGFGVKK